MKQLICGDNLDVPKSDAIDTASVDLVYLGQDRRQHLAGDSGLTIEEMLREGMPKLPNQVIQQGFRTGRLAQRTLL